MTQTRTYVTGGTSNNEGWLTEPNHLAQELTKGANTNECCCVYNMLKLTRKLYTWSGDPRLFDYYERIFYSHRLGTTDTANGHTQYYLGLVPASWRTFGTEEDSLWCCNGTGVEEYSKLADSIYFAAADDTVYVNLFIPSELSWTQRGVRIRQTNVFPVEPETRIQIEGEAPQTFALNIRIPSWVESVASVAINGKVSEVSAASGSYLVLKRTWHPGDIVQVKLPMGLHVERMPDDPDFQAFLYGPLVLAARVSAGKVPERLVIGPMGPEFKKQPPAAIPTLKAQDLNLQNWRAMPAGDFSFEVTASERRFLFVPFNSVGAGERYSLYWKVV